METTNLKTEFFTTGVPAHWQVFDESREGDERVIRLTKNTHQSGSVVFRARRYKWSETPKSSATGLSKNVLECAEQHMKQMLYRSSGPAFEEVTHASGKRQMAAASFKAFDTVADVGVWLRIWQTSDGRHFIFLIYSCDNLFVSEQQRDEEMSECEQIVSSMKFNK